MQRTAPGQVQFLLYQVELPLRMREIGAALLGDDDHFFHGDDSVPGNGDPGLNGIDLALFDFKVGQIAVPLQAWAQQPGAVMG